MLNISEINDYNQFLKLKNEWDAVAKRSINENIYLTWEWCSTYWKHLGKGKKLIVLKIEDDDESIAFAPLRQSKYKLWNWFGYNVIEPMCYGPTDYNGFLMTKRNEECLKLFFKYLYDRIDWDFMHLMDIPETSAILNHLPLLYEYNYVLEKGAECPYLPISKSTHTELSKNFAYNLSRQMRKLKKEYHKVDVIEHDKFGTVEKAMKTFFSLHENRWQSKNMLGILSQDELKNFHLDVARIFSEKGWLALYFLVVDEEPIASLYGFKYNNNISLYLGGFNVDFSKYSPQNLLLYELLKKCIENGINKLDFLRGSEQYKQKWCSNYSMNYNLKIVNYKIGSKLYDRIIQLRARSKM